MTLASPLWLLAALAVAALTILFWRRADRRRRADLERFASAHLLPDLTAEVSPRRRRVKRALLLAAIVLLGLAFAGPQYGFTWQETQRRGIDVLIALDVSRSMLAQDVVPNRLERAKLAIIDLVEKLGGDRVGLIAFAGTAFLQCPMTLDHGAFLEALAALQPGIIPAPGSNLASAIQVAQDALRTQARNVKLLVLFSDGEDLAGDAIDAARAAAADGIKIYTVGVGSPAGELIPVTSKDGRTEFLKDPDGQYVKSRLDEETLRKVAEATGAFYEPLGQRGEGVEAVYERALAPLPKEELASRMRRVPLDRFQWPLALALLCLAIEPLIGERRGRLVRSSAAVLLVLGASTAQAASPREAEQYYAAGEYEKALAAYREAAKDGDPKLTFNLGAAAYKAGAYGDAAAAFADALRSEDPALQERSFYNLGNAQFRIGQKVLEQDPQATMQAWQQAIDAYDQALRLDPNDEDARFNREFVQRELEKLQQQQQQQQGQQQEQRKQDQNQDEQQSQDQQQAQQDEERDQQDAQQQAGGAPQEDEQQRDQQQTAQQNPEDGEQEQQPERKEQEGRDEQRQADAKPAGGSPDEQPPQESQQRADAQTPPGRMSPKEARDLLDSLQDDATSLPALQAAQQPRRPRSDEEVRDW